jgi:hypothetical protein
MDRRDFLRGTAALGAGLIIGQAGVLPASADTRIRWGALCLPRDGQRDQIEAVKALQNKVGRKFATTHFRLPWDRDLVNNFTKWSVQSGHVPIISWFTRQSGGGMISWSSVASGQHDDRITTQARSLKQAGWSGYFCFHKEPENEGNPQDWKAAHDRVFGIFHNVGVKFKFVPTFTAYTYAGGHGGINTWLPPRYHLLGADGYNRVNSTNGWRSFERIFQPAHKVARNKGRRLYIIEYGSTEGAPGAKAQWLKNARATMKSWPQVTGCSYNHEHTDCVYWVDTSSSSLRAFRHMGADPVF